MIRAKLGAVRRKVSRMLNGQQNTGDPLSQYSMVHQYGLEKLRILATDVLNRGIAGDYVETGVCNGGSAAVVAKVMAPTPKQVWLYDSFQGMPPTTELDGTDAKEFVGKCVGSEELVREAISKAGFPLDRCVIRKGWFQDTFKQPLPERVAMLHIDADWYDSVKLALDTFYDRVSDGGTIVLDDFAYWEGCREAFYDFVKERGLKPVLERYSYSQAFWVKNRTHNREFGGKHEIP